MRASECEAHGNFAPNRFCIACMYEEEHALRAALWTENKQLRAENRVLREGLEATAGHLDEFLRLNGVQP